MIDGHTAFTGGINLADEYINQKERFGHWKDTAVMIKGDAVQNFTIMFCRCGMSQNIRKKIMKISDSGSGGTAQRTGVCTALWR